MKWRRNPGPSEATRAREKAERDLDAVRAETPMYRALGERLREIREKNHLAEAVAATFRGDRT
jgi:hypothetical protein